MEKTMPATLILEGKEIKLTSKQLKAIPCFLREPNIERACQETKLARGTYYKWLKNPNFSQELEKQRTALFEDSISKLKDLFSLSVVELSNLLKSGHENIRLRTCELIIKFCVDFQEVKELGERVTVLEDEAFTYSARSR